MQQRGSGPEPVYRLPRVRCCMPGACPLCQRPVSKPGYETEDGEDYCKRNGIQNEQGISLTFSEVIPEMRSRLAFFGFFTRSSPLSAPIECNLTTERWVRQSPYGNRGSARKNSMKTPLRGTYGSSSSIRGLRSAVAASIMERIAINNFQGGLLQLREASKEKRGHETSHLNRSLIIKRPSRISTA